MANSTEMFTRSLRCPLTEPERIERSDRIARLVTTTSELREELKSEVAGRKAVIAEKAAEIQKLSTEIRDRATFREIDCERDHDYARGMVTEKRLDTGEEISSRPMTYSERQLELGIELEPEPPEEANAKPAEDLPIKVTLATPPPKGKVPTSGKRVAKKAPAKKAPAKRKR